MELPIEYTMKTAPGSYRAGSWDKYGAETLVKDRIKEALAKAGKPDASFSVKLIETDYKWKTTRVYAGGWMYTRRGSNKSFISSKRNEAIDLKRAVEFIIEKNDEQDEARERYDRQRTAQETSHAAAKAMEEELDLNWNSTISISSSSYAEKVKVTYTVELPIDEAREIAKMLKNLNK